LETHASTTDRLLTRTEIAHLAGVKRPTITTWTKRHPDFPQPVRVGDEDYFALESVVAWLDRRPVPAKELSAGEQPGLTYGQRLRRSLSGTVARGPAHTSAAEPGGSGQALAELLGPLGTAVRKDGGSPAEYLMLLICLVFLRNRAEEEWRAVREAAAHREDARPDRLIRLIADLTDQALRAHGILPGVLPSLERLKPGSAADLAAVIGHCDNLGAEAADVLLMRFDAEAQLPGESYFTPAGVASLMASLALGDRTTNASVYDPYLRGGELITAGSGVLTAEPRSVRGESPNRETLRLAGMKLAIHGIPARLGEANAALRGDDGRPGAGFDVVLANPPFNSPMGPGDDPDRRWIFVTSDEREHMIRSQMLEQGVVTAVVSLPPRLFPRTDVAVSLWLLRPPAGAAGSVLFVDARRMTMSELPDANRLIREVFDRRHLLADRTVEKLQGGGLAVAAGIDAVRRTNYSLNPADYTRAAPAITAGDVDQVTGRLGELGNLRKRLAELDERVEKLRPLQRGGSGGDLRPGWRRLPLKELCEIQAGPSPSRFRTEDQPGDASVPVVMPRHLIAGRAVAPDAKQVAGGLAQRLSKFRLETNDILLVRTGAATEPALVGEQQHGWLFDTNLLRLRARPDMAEPRFLAGFLSLPAVRDWIRDRSTGSAIAFITTQNLERLEVPVPPLAEQRAIGSALTALDEQIAAHEAFARAAVRARTTVSEHLMLGGMTLQ
jgi:type I restriction enzyme M protein